MAFFLFFVPRRAAIRKPLDSVALQEHNRAMAEASTIALVALGVSVVGTTIAAIRFFTESPLFPKSKVEFQPQLPSLKKNS